MTGILFAIGGAVRLDGPILRSFLECSGGPEGQIIILPTASSQPDSGKEYAEGLAALGLKRPAWVLPVHQRSEANQAEFIQGVRQASGIFITGGHPVRLTATLSGTLLHQELLDAHRRGVTTAGTSAGAAALSTLMLSRGSSGAFARQQIAQFASGLGLVDGIIFDQHFRQRNRLGRLIFAIASNLQMIGVGIDEDTAIQLERDTLTVIGSGAAAVVDGSSVTDSDIAAAKSGQVIAISGIGLHILTAGCTFDLRNRTACIPIRNLPEG